MSAKKVTFAHPSYIEMIVIAIQVLNEENGSTKQAIVKYLHQNYKIDIFQSNFLINNALRNGVKNGILIQTKGQGARGSFKVPDYSEKKLKSIKTRLSILFLTIIVCATFFFSI